ncbi:MAG: cobalamin-independent methionine synthase II family protein [Chloroflexota bacterium]|nr:cobalamin-independent methionine synthase II family protein [Chloroflexota bacterium]MDE2970193.1 cobalamin-independent methionine synthase II family protein [Chloroflexota bacterium]
MKRSEDRILTTHAGSLPRPKYLQPLLDAKRRGEPYDPAELDQKVKQAVKEVVDQQVAYGIDVVGDGEESKPSFNLYLDERISGFEMKLPPPGQVPTMSMDGRDRTDFREFYSEESGFGLRLVSSAYAVQEQQICTGPLSYIGQDIVAADVATFQAALEGVDYAEGFIPTLAPGTIDHRLFNEYYKSEEEFVYAIAEMMRPEYEAIANAGFIVQIDDPGLPDTWDMLISRPSLEEYRKYADLRVEALNHALSNVPPSLVRYHICWGSWHGPHTYDIPLEDIVDIMLKVNADAYSIEAGNVRHDHEWRVWETTKLPDGKILVPGVVSHATNVVEHPRLVADRLVKYASLVGRENVIAGTDCGLGGRVHQQIAWAKFKALKEGADLATSELWG